MFSGVLLLRIPKLLCCLCLFKCLVSNWKAWTCWTDEKSQSSLPLRTKTSSGSDSSNVRMIEVATGQGEEFAAEAFLDTLIICDGVLYKIL